MNEIKRLAKQASLPSPLDVLDKSFLRSSVEHANSKRPLLKQVLDTKRRRTKREVVGELTSDPGEIIVLDDGELLGEHLTLDFQVLEISIFHDGRNKIYGFKAVYLIDGEKVQGQCNVLKQVKDLPSTKVSVLKMQQPNDGLKFVSGFSLEFIEYLKLETVKGESMVVGSLQGEKAKELKEFCIEIKKEDVPTVLFGGLKFNSGKKSSSLV